MKKAPSKRANRSKEKWRNTIATVSEEGNRKLLISFLSTAESKRGDIFRPATRQSYAFVLRDLSNFKNKSLFEMTRRDIDEFIAHRREKGDSVNNINRTKIAICSFYRWLCKYEVDIEIPTTGIKFKGKKKIPFYLSPTEVERLCQAAKDRSYRDYAIFKTLFHTGLRASELLSLSMDPKPDGNYIDLERGIVHINKTKSAERRSFKVPDWSQLKPILEKYIGFYRKDPKDDPNNPLFTGRWKKGICHQRLSVIFKRTAIDSGIDRLELFPERTYKDITPHLCRKTFATSYIRAGGDIIKLQKILGHQSIVTTGIYLGWVKAELDQDDTEIGLYSNNHKQEPTRSIPEPIPQPRNEYIIPIHATKKDEYNPAYA